MICKIILDLIWSSQKIPDLIWSSQIRRGPLQIIINSSAEAAQCDRRIISGILVIFPEFFFSSEVDRLSTFVNFWTSSHVFISAAPNLWSDLFFDETTSISCIEDLCIHLNLQICRQFHWWGPRACQHLDDSLASADFGFCYCFGWCFLPFQLWILFLRHIPSIGSLSEIISVSQIISDPRWSPLIKHGPPEIIIAHQRTLPLLVDWRFLDLWRFFLELFIIRGWFSPIFCDNSIFFLSFHLGRPSSWIWIWSGWDQDQFLHKTSLPSSPPSDLCLDHQVGPSCGFTHCRQGRLLLLLSSFTLLLLFSAVIASPLNIFISL